MEGGICCTLKCCTKTSCMLIPSLAGFQRGLHLSHSQLSFFVPAYPLDLASASLSGNLLVHCGLWPMHCQRVGKSGGALAVLVPKRESQTAELTLLHVSSDLHRAFKLLRWINAYSGAQKRANGSAGSKLSLLGRSPLHRFEVSALGVPGIFTA